MIRHYNKMTMSHESFRDYIILHDLLSQKGSYVAGVDTSYRQGNEEQSLGPPLDCPTSTEQNSLYLLRYKLDSIIKMKLNFRVH